MIVKREIEKESSELETKIREVFLEVTQNLKDVRSGQSVLLKPALNSPDPYPATTHPLAVKVVAEELLKKGAKVIVGDQSGIEHVIHTKDGVVKGNSIDNFKASGIYDACKELEIEWVAFEQDGWDEGFVHVKPETAKSWTNGFYITKWIDQVDHIVNLPRVSSHLMAGFTLGFKNWVGILREDSRAEFHKRGTFKLAVKRMFRDLDVKNLETNEQSDIIQDDVDIFWKMMTEISLAVKDKLLTTLFIATKANTTVGPDAGIGFLKSYVAYPDEGLVFASNNPLEAEIEALKLLKYLYINETPFRHKVVASFISLINGKTSTLDKVEFEKNGFIKHARSLGY